MGSSGRAFLLVVLLTTLCAASAEVRVKPSGKKRKKKGGNRPSTPDERFIQAKVAGFEDGARAWMRGEADGDDLLEAFAALREALDLLEEGDAKGGGSFVPSPPPVELASLVLATGSTALEYGLGKRLLRRSLEVMPVDQGSRERRSGGSQQASDAEEKRGNLALDVSGTLGPVCRDGGGHSARARAPCQDFYSYLCALTTLADGPGPAEARAPAGTGGKGGAAAPRGSGAVEARSAGQQCVDEFTWSHSAQMPPAVSWPSPGAIATQLPALRRQPWWDDAAADVPWHRPLLVPLAAALPAIRHEVGLALSARHNANRAMFEALWRPVAHGGSQRHFFPEGRGGAGDSEGRDRRGAYDVLPLLVKGQFSEAACEALPRTCLAFGYVAGAGETQAARGGEMSETAKAVQEFIRHPRAPELWSKRETDQGFHSPPPLGVQLHRLQPGALARPHMGSPGRLSSSAALHSPAGSILEVGGEARSLTSNSEVFTVWDDSFLHTMLNGHAAPPSASAGAALGGGEWGDGGQMVVLTFTAWHPDLLKRSDDAGVADEEGRAKEASGDGSNKLRHIMSSKAGATAANNMKKQKAQRHRKRATKKNKAAAPEL